MLVSMGVFFCVRVCVGPMNNYVSSVSGVYEWEHVAVFYQFSKFYHWYDTRIFDNKRPMNVHNILSRYFLNTLPIHT